MLVTVLSSQYRVYLDIDNGYYNAQNSAFGHSWLRVDADDAMTYFGQNLD